MKIKIYRLLMTLLAILLMGCASSPHLILTPAPSATPTLLASISPRVTAMTIRPTTRLPAKAMPTQTYVHWPTPTGIHNLVERQPNDPNLQLPGEFVMDIYHMNQPPIPEELGYEEILRSLGGLSRVYALPQGYAFWDTAVLALMEANNAALAPFGYRLVSKATGLYQSRWFELYQGDTKILDPITIIGPVSVNRSGTDFLMLVEANGTQLVRNFSLSPWKYVIGWIANSRPQYLGDDVMHIEQAARPTPANTLETPQPVYKIIQKIQVFQGDRLIYQAAYQDRVAASGVIGFWTYGEHWALETVDSVVIDGQPVNARYGYDKSYEFHLLGGRPLFFFEKKGQVGMNLNGKEIPFPFERVPHYGCCSAGLVNPVQIGDLLLFYAWQGSAPYYIELAVDVPPAPETAAEAH